MTTQLTTLVSFNGVNGQGPAGALILDAKRRPVRHDLWWRREGRRHGVRDPEHWHGRRAGLRQRPDHGGHFRRGQRGKSLCWVDQSLSGLIIDANGDPLVEHSPDLDGELLSALVALVDADAGALALHLGNTFDAPQ